MCYIELYLSNLYEPVNTFSRSNLHKTCCALLTKFVIWWWQRYSSDFLVFSFNTEINFIIIQTIWILDLVLLFCIIDLLKSLSVNQATAIPYNVFCFTISSEIKMLLYSQILKSPNLSESKYFEVKVPSNFTSLEFSANFLPSSRIANCLNGDNPFYKLISFTAWKLLFCCPLSSSP